MLTDIHNRSVSTHQHPLDEAEAKLAEQERLLETQLKDVRQILSNIRATRAASRTNDSRDYPPVTPGQYAGMRTSKALEAYLKGRAGFKIPIARVVKDLLAGGVDPGKPHSKKDPSPEKNLDHKLKIVIRQNEKLVQWNENDENWPMWLAPTATEAPKPRKKYKPRGM